MPAPILMTEISSPLANSYVARDDATALLDSTFINENQRTQWMIQGQDNQTRLLLVAARRLQICNWKGQRTSSSQALAWPRSGVVFDGQLINLAAIPDDIRLAQALLAAIYAGESLTLSSLNHEIGEPCEAETYKAVDDAEVKYRNPLMFRTLSTQDRSPLPESAQIILEPYLRSRNGLPGISARTYSETPLIKF